ncbi:UvrD-helicase domain-containing protein [Paraburkholderia tropica]|uniref:UvrD-helicase domain-containing protein n=1 Tax=Paraburkholderia tropica TaxID=92647 RepID=UPI002ABD5195|nr:UvrD-helicase domain-containing protein [Paraburkholderia tropica]
MPNFVTLAVAGSRKTQSVIEHCASLPTERRALVLTFTQANQEELRRRLAQYAGDHLGVEVMGWYTFLLRHFAKPFFPFKFPGKRVLGFNYEGRPFTLAKGIHRFLDSKDAAYACELGRLSNELISASGGSALRRLEALYDEILVDEVQDLSAHDWEILDHLLDSTIDIRMVGDIRQSVLATNPRSAKNRRYAYADSIEWFRERERQNRLSIIERAVTWRCHQGIASFSDTIFDSTWAFPPTRSLNEVTTEHDGVFLLKKQHIEAYIERFSPQCLRHSVSSGAKLDLPFINFKVSKGATYKRVLILPTAPITAFIQKGVALEAGPAASFYVAVTRAEQSVAIVLDKCGETALPFWVP